MERIKLVFSYDGAGFSGYQIQPGKRTVQEEIEKVLAFLLKENVRIYASGRTDAGVSALAQVAHFDTEQAVNEKKLLDSLNALLPDDIGVSSVEKVGEDFDARFSVKRKTYNYFFYISKYTNPIFDKFAVRINDYADVNKMSEAAKYFVGTHDFKAFVSRKSGKTNFERTIFDAKVYKVYEGLYAFSVTGDGFLYNMVRIMFGALTLAAYGKIKPSDILEIINAKNRALSGKTMPAKPLLLVGVQYNENKKIK